MSSVVEISSTSRFVSSSYAFVVPRYGATIGGGAETLVRLIAMHLAARGDQVEVLTTCAKDNRTWENELEPGVSVEDGVIVKRFLVDPRDLECWIPYQLQIHDGVRPPIDNQLDWLANSVNSVELYKYISDYQAQYRAIFFAPYLFGTTFWGSLVAPEKSILIPCLHDENYAYLESIRSMFKLVKGCIFNSAPERDLAYQLYGQISGDEVGMGYDFKSYAGDYAKYFEDDFPYVLYIGRKETGKNVHLLIDNFIAYKEQQNANPDLKLVIAGGGDFSDLFRDAALTRDDVIDIGYISEEQKRSLMQHALYFCPE